jgi:hypothetical protein
LGDVIVADENGDQIPDVQMIDNSILVGAEPAADLVVNQLSADWVEEKSTYNLGYVIDNRGNVDADAFEVGLYIDGSTDPVVTETISALIAGDSYSGNFTNHQLTITGADDKIMVCVDVVDAIEESFEDNNCRELVFEQITYTINILTCSNGTVLIEPEYGEPWPKQPQDREIAYGTELKVTALPLEGYQFDHWIGILEGLPESTTITVERDYNIQACFTEIAVPDESEGISRPLIMLIVIGASIVIGLLVYLLVIRRGQEA